MLKKNMFRSVFLTFLLTRFFCAGQVHAVPFEEDITLLAPIAGQIGTTASLGEGEKMSAGMGGAVNLVSEDGWSQTRFLVTGKTGQALAYSAEKNLSSEAWSVSFEHIGRDWDVEGTGRDIFFRAEGPGAVLELVRDKSPRLELELTVNGSSTSIAAASLEGVDMSKWRFITVTCGEGVAAIYVDKEKIGDGSLSTRGLEFERVIFGQAGLGENENRLMRNFIIYNRALEHPEVARTFYHYSRIAPERLAVINKTSRSITIDGVIDPEEWRDATVITGLVDNTHVRAHETYRAMSRLFAPYQTRFYVTYDEEYLYVAMDSPTPDFVIADPHGTAMGTLLQNTRMAFDSDVDRDDYFEVRIVIPQRNGDTYRFISNGLNTRYDFTIGGSHPDAVLGGIDLGWDPDWIVDNVVDLEGGWQVEARIPLSAISAPAPGDGTEWGMNFIRGWRHLLEENNAWTYGLRLEPDREFITGAYALGVPGLVRFRESGPAVRLFHTGNLSIGELRLEGMLVNTSAASADVRLSVSSDSGELEWSDSFTVEGNGEVPFAFSGDIINPLTNFVTFAADSGGEDIYLLNLPVFLGTDVNISSRSYPTAGKFIIDADLKGLAAIPAGELSIEASLFRNVGGRVSRRPVLRNRLDSLRSHNAELPFDISGLADGLYMTRVTVRHGREALVEEDIEFNKLPMPDWYGNKIGISDKVPPPFEPLRVDTDNDIIRVWGREYHYDGGLFPKQIRILGKNSLRSPMHLELVTEAGETIADARGDVSVEWKLISDTRVEGVRRVRLGGYTVENSFWMEYDGFTWNDLRITSEDSLDLQGLKLLIPYTREFSDVINPYDYSMRDTGKLRPEGWNGGQRPVWVGNAVGGIQWLAESDGDWNVSDTDKQVVVRNDDGVATMEINFVDLPTHLRTPLPLPFGFAATPAKPAPRIDPNHNPTLGWSYAWYPPDGHYSPGSEGWYEGAFISAGGGSIRRSKYISNTEPRLTYSGPYVVTMRVRADNPEFEQFGDEWFASERDRKGDETARISQAPKSFQDYFVWRYWKLYQQAPFASLYYDVANESTGINRYGGQGYRRRDGSWTSSRAILGSREIFKRLYTMVKMEHPDAMIKNHSSGMINMGYHAFTDFYVTGENTISMLTQDIMDYRGKITPADYRADMMGHNFGFRGEFLYQFTRSGRWTYDTLREAGPYMVDHIMGLSLLHDAGYWSSYGPWEYVLRMERALERHGWSAGTAFLPAYDFIPYWQQDIVDMPEGHYATFYTSSRLDKVFAVFYNDTETAGEQRISIDWEKLGFDDLSRIKLENTGHEIVEIKEAGPIWWQLDLDFKPNPDYYARIEGDELVVSLHPYDYQLVVLWIE